MWKKFSLKNRILTVIGVLMLLTLMGGSIMIWYTYRIENLLVDVTETDLAAYQSAESLAESLVNQKGFVSYYFMDSDPDWLRQLGEYRQIFRERLNEARMYSEGSEESAILQTIEKEYGHYVTSQDIVISHYEAGQREAGEVLHHQARKRFFRILDLCSYYKDIHTKSILNLEQTHKIQARNLRMITVSGMAAVFSLGIVLAFILVKGILMPIQKLVQAASKENRPEKTKNIVQNLSHSIHDLIEKYDQTSSHLEKSRAHLLQSEKMAMVGKLAAGMAHSIRNPFTSVQMRLFSLRRYPDLSTIQREDLDVISEEIRHIDTIVQNFLEFSRAPKMKLQPISPSVIVDNTLQLLKHRLKSYEVETQLIRKNTLPLVQADPEQIKEVLINIIINACEVMHHGGSITIREEIRNHASESMAAIRISDNGPGMPETVREKIFEPFFTTKEEGTGLGLSIVKRIIDEHQGRINLISHENQGTTFSIQLPLIGV